MVMQTGLVVIVVGIARKELDDARFMINGYADLRD